MLQPCNVSEKRLIHLPKNKVWKFFRVVMKHIIDIIKSPPEFLRRIFTAVLPGAILAVDIAFVRDLCGSKRENLIASGSA